MLLAAMLAGYRTNPDGRLYGIGVACLVLCFLKHNLLKSLAVLISRVPPISPEPTKTVLKGTAVTETQYGTGWKHALRHVL